MPGTGQANVHELAEIARAAIKDGIPSPALEAFASLGGAGIHSSNEERDLHRWLHNLWNFDLEPYYVTFFLASGLYVMQVFGYDNFFTKLVWSVM